METSIYTLVVGFHLDRMETSDVSWDWSGMEAFSEQIFGATHRLSVLAVTATAPTEELYAQAIADDIGRRAGEHMTIERFTREQLKKLQAFGLLKANPTPPARPSGRSGKPPQYLVRSDDEFWRCLQALGNRFRRPAYDIAAGGPHSSSGK